MKKILKVLGWGLGGVVLLVAAAVGYLFLKFPDVGPVPSITVQATPERLARGAYLVNHVSHCLHCHSVSNSEYFSGPPLAGTEGQGGEEFEETIYAHNITPAALGSVSDGLLYRAITTGVDKDGKAMFPIMPYRHIDLMSEEDILSIIAHIRTLKPIENSPPPTSLKFPLNLIVRTIPEKHTPHDMPDTSNAYEYGKYLVNAANCVECHTQRKDGRIIPGLEFSGGFEFHNPNGQVVRSANLTPDEETGIASMSETDFVNKFKFYDNPEGQTIKVASMESDSPMPWTMFAGMTERDLGAIYKYLRSVKPIKNKVEKFTGPSK